MLVAEGREEDTVPPARPRRRILPDPWWPPLLVGAVATVASAAAAARLGYSSDDVSQILFVRDLHHGPTAVFFGSDNFILRLPLVAATDGWLSDGRGYLVIVSVALVALGALAALWWRRPGRDERSSDHLLVALALAWAFANVGVAITIARPLVRNVELGMAVAGVFALDRLTARQTDGERRVRWPTLAAVAVALGLFLYNDPYFTFLFGIPVVAVLGLLAFLRHDRTAGRLAGASAAGVVASFVLPPLTDAVGFTAVAPKVRPISGGELDDAVRGLLRQAGGTLGTSVTHGDVIPRPLGILNLGVYAVLLAVAGWALARLLRRPRELRPSQLLLPLGALLPVPAYIAGGSSLEAGTSRYLVLTPIALAACVTLVRLPKAAAIGVSAVLAAATLANLGYAVHDATCSGVSCPATGADAVWNETEAFAHDLELAGVHKVFGNYWDMNITGFASDGRIDAVPIVCAGSAFGVWNWNVSTRRISARATRSFLLLGGGLVDPCSAATAAAQFGPPAQTLTIHGRTILAYDGDLADRMARVDP